MKRQRKTQAGAEIILLVAALLCMPLLVQAGNLEPSGPPTAGTMHSLEDIYQKLDAIQKAMPTTTTTAASNRFVDNGNGTVTDTRTGLVWLKNANPCSYKNWNDAVTYCSSLANGQAGLTDGSTAGQWRLPSKEELEGIGTDPPATWQSRYPSVTWTKPGAPFTNVQSDWYWSGTTYVYYTDNAWNVLMNVGYMLGYSKDYGSYIWPVRGGN